MVGFRIGRIDRDEVESTRCCEEETTLEVVGLDGKAGLMEEEEEEEQDVCFLPFKNKN